MNNGTCGTATDDRRSALREASRERFVDIEHEATGSHRALLVDVSRTGVGFTSNASFACGEIVTVHSPQGVDLPACRAKIVRQSLLDGDEMRFDYGARYEGTQDERRHAWFLALRKRSED